MIIEKPVVSVIENNDPFYHLKMIQKIHTTTLMDIDQMAMFLEKGSKPCIQTVKSYTEYVTGQLDKFNKHLSALKKFKQHPCLSEYSIQNFGGIINKFLQLIKFQHEQN